MVVAHYAFIKMRHRWVIVESIWVQLHCCCLIQVCEGVTPIHAHLPWNNASSVQGSVARIGGFPSVLDSNACSSNDGVVIIKHYQNILNPWLQTINVSVSSDSKSLLIFDGFLLHLNIDLLKKLGGGGMLVLLCMTNTSHEINVEDLLNFDIA